MNKKQGKLVTFYSYKGGVGRTMSLVNIAAIMAKKGKKVLLIDWDLEAPGLHEFFGNYDKSKLGIVDLMTIAIADELVAIDDFRGFFESELKNYLDSVTFNEETSISVDLIKAGKFDDDYTKKLQAIDWLDFYKNYPSFYRELAVYLESKYDYIFVDSRTGLSDTGGICTMLLPQILVTVFAINKQNISGVIDVAKQALEYRFDSYDDRELKVMPLPSRIDEQNSNQYGIWLSDYTRKFEELFREVYQLDECKLKNYFNKAQIPYKSPHSYGENVTVFSEDINNSFFISYHYSEFGKLMDDDKAIWEIMSNEEIELNKKNANQLIQKGVSAYNKNEFEEAIKFFEASTQLNPDSNYGFSWLGLAYSEYSKNCVIEEKEISNLKACSNFEQAIELNDKDEISYNNWGVALGDLAEEKQGEERDSLCYMAFEKYQKAIEIKPDFYDALTNWGIALGYLAKEKQGEERDSLYHLAIEKFQKAIEIKPDFYDALTNWGIALGYLAKEKQGGERDILYHLAIEKFQKAIEIKPDFYDALTNWGIALGYLAKEKQGGERDTLYHLAIEKYQKAIEIKSNPYDAFNNWGNDLGNLAEEKQGEERENLYHQAFEKFQKAIEIKPDFYSAFNNFAGTLLNYYHHCYTNKKQEVLEDAFVRASMAHELGGYNYNLACAYALKGDKSRAYTILELALNKKEVDTEHISKDKDWEIYKEDVEFNRIINKYRIS